MSQDPSNADVIRHLLSQEVFIHEAAHALAYDALEQPIKRVYVRQISDNRDEGLTERGTDVMLSFPSMAFVFMAGASATIFIAGRPFDAAVKRFSTDFCICLRQASKYCPDDNSKMALMATLRAFIHGFGKEWALQYWPPILYFASFLKSKERSSGYWELQGEELTNVLRNAWGALKPSQNATEQRAAAAWDSVSGLSVEVGHEWQLQYLRDFAIFRNRTD